MGKFRGVISSFHNSRSKDPILPSSSSSSAALVHSSIKRHVSSAITSIGGGCGCISETPVAASSHPQSSEKARCRKSAARHQFQWEEEDKWHVVANINHHNNIVPLRSENSAKPPTRTKRCVRKNKTTRTRMSTSSAGSGIFCSADDDYEDDENNVETEALVSSSRSFSTGDESSSPELFKFNPQLETIREAAAAASSRRKMKRRRRRRKNEGEEVVVGSPARLSRFQKWVMPCRVLEGKVRESYAVVKKSEDPREDFKRSMAEMIMEKEMFHENDLEQLLQCFLSLNSKVHHGVIIQAFSEIWQDLFSVGH
ncbi:Transcription repressor OFP7 [Linum perenne]